MVCKKKFFLFTLEVSERGISDAPINCRSQSCARQTQTQMHQFKGALFCRTIY